MSKDETSIMKPITLVREDFLQSLVELCNNSGLPYFIVEGILKDFLQDIHIASQKQLEADRARYNQEMENIAKSKHNINNQGE